MSGYLNHEPFLIHRNGYFNPFLPAPIITGPALLADFDFSTPAESWDFSSAFATDEWLLQETSGAYANNVGSETLANTGGLQGQEAVGLRTSTSYSARKAWESTAVTDYLKSSGTTAGDSDSEDLSVRIVFRGQGFLSADYMIAKHGVSGPGWRLLMSGATPGPRAELHDGTNTAVIQATAGAYDDAAWHYATFFYDFSADMLYLRTDKGETSVSTAALTGSVTNALNLFVNSLIGSSRGHVQTQYAYAGVSVGANAQAFYDEAITLPGTDPTGLLTTQSRASLISVPVDATHVAHFAPDTLPIGYHGSFSDTNKLGLYCNSAVTNLNAYSEALSNWTQSGTSVTADSQADSPDGFRSMSKITAGAANDFIKEVMTTVASTEYTMSVYIEESTVGVTGRVIFYDETGAVELASQTFTGSASPQVVSVTATTNVGQISSSSRIEIDTSGEHVFAWGFQTNLGNARGATIRTNGAAASLVASDYAVVAAAGVLMQTSAGEIEAVYVAAFQSVATSNVYIFDAGGVSAGSNINRRFIWLASNGDTPESYGYDSGGTNVWAVPSGVQDTDGQENTSVVRWDSSGGLAVGGGADAELLYNGAGSAVDVGAFSSSESITNFGIGGRRTSVLGQPDAFIQRIRIWDGERA